jgi:hypothetical protein
MCKRKGLIKALINFHWKNIVRDNARIDAVEMEERMKVSSCQWTYEQPGY